MPEGAFHYVDEREVEGKLEPPELRGVVFEQWPDGRAQILRYSGETTPEGPDLPADAVVDNEVVFYVDGIGQRLSEHQRQIRSVLHGGQSESANLSRPILGIHEGAGRSTMHDIVRIGKAMALTKSLQYDLAPLDWVRSKAYQVDPSVHSIHNLLRQALVAGHQVTLMCHSGGGAQTALALSILAREEDGRWTEKISDQVRILSLAGAASEQDFKMAGIKSENLLYTGSGRDPVYSAFRNHLGPYSWKSNFKAVYDAAQAGLNYLREKKIYHAPDYLFAQHQQTEGNRLEAFLLGGPGGKYELDLT